MKIAFFDVLHHARRVLPHEQFVFYADETHVPYGTKTRAEVESFVAEAFEFLLKQDVKAIVVACNTATSVAVPMMRARYDLPIIGMEPAAKKALALDPVHRVLVTATPITVAGEKMEHLIERVDHEHLVDRLALPELVTFAENMAFDGPEVEAYLRKELAPYQQERGELAGEGQEQTVEYFYSGERVTEEKELERIEMCNRQLDKVYEL